MTCLRNRSRHALFAGIALALLAGSAPTFALGNGGAAHSVADHATWVVQKTTRLASLHIGHGAAVSAPTGDTVTLTVNGVELPLKPGNYQGDVVLTVTASILVPFDMMGHAFGPYHFRTAVYVDNGKLVADKSVLAAAVHGNVTNTSADNLSIVSKAEDFNGIIVTGQSTYTVNHPTIDFIGNGGNDFAGFGAAIMASGHAKLTVNGAKIRTRGAVRTAVWVGGDSTVTVNNSDIETYDGVLPASYKFSIVPGEMMEVPYGLGIYGNVRATNLMGHGTVYYNHDHIRAEAWGALSSDGNGPDKMVATDDLIETVKSGYGAYANGLAHDYFHHCVFNVADYGLIIGGPGDGTFTDGTVVNSRRFGVMMHQGTGGSVLTIEKGSVFNTGSTTIEVKGRGTRIVVDDATLDPGNGVILQAMDNDDPIMRAMMAKHPGNMPGAGPGQPHYSGDVIADFRQVHLKGDIYQAMTDVGDMDLSFENASIDGVISLATARPASGKEPTRATFRQIGNVTDTVGPVAGKYGLKLTLGDDAHWTVAGTSYLTGLSLASGATLAAPAHEGVRLIVNGREQPVKAGSTYAGRIVVEVVPVATKA